MLHLKLVVPSDPRFLSVVRATVGELGIVCGLPEESSQQVVLAVDEALANIIRHAYKNCCDREIELMCDVDDERMEFTLLDQGEPPDMTKICGQPLDEVSLSGRGTHLMKSCMDEMCYARVPAGNQLKLVKRLPAAGAP